MALANAVLRTIRRYDMLPSGGRVLVALSGGADSVALLNILLELHDREELVVVGAAHFNHGLRGGEADEDERFCAELARSAGIPFEAGRADVRAKARREKRSIEEAARIVRYEFLMEAAARLHADAVAVGHTLDDQAETFLLRLIRGAGARGLGGIRPRAGNVIRPLLDTRRADLRAYSEERGLSHRDDASNLDVSIPRNRIRHELIPYLERSFSPGIVEVLAREAASAREDEDRLESEAIDLASTIVLTDTESGDPPSRGTASADRRSLGEGGRAIGASGDRQRDRKIEVDADALSALHPALASRVARAALRRLAGDRFIGFEQVRRFLDVVQTGSGGAALSLPGQQAVKHGGRVHLRPEPPRVRRVGNSFQFPLSIPGEVVLDRQGMAVSAAWSRPEETTAADIARRSRAAAEADCFVRGPKLPLVVRSRRPGDRFMPPGLDGRSKKLQDYLVDRKVPRAERDLLPLVVDDDNRIVWVVGHAVAERFRVPGPSDGVISLKARRLGGEG